MKKFCSNCGHAIVDGNYCEKCGRKFETSPTFHPYLIGGGSALIVLAILHVILLKLV